MVPHDAQRGATLSVSCTPDRCCFSSLAAKRRSQNAKRTAKTLNLTISVCIYHAPFDLEQQTDTVRLLFQINRKMVNTIWFRFDLIKFRKDFSVYIHWGKFCNFNNTLKRVIEILWNWYITKGILTRIARVILVEIPIEICQFTRIPMTLKSVVLYICDFSFLMYSAWTIKIIDDLCMYT